MALKDWKQISKRDVGGFTIDEEIITYQNKKDNSILRVYSTKDNPSVEITSKEGVFSLESKSGKMTKSKANRYAKSFIKKHSEVKENNLKGGSYKIEFI